jgi:hypothetical protein
MILYKQNPRYIEKFNCYILICYIPILNLNWIQFLVLQMLIDWHVNMRRWVRLLRTMQQAWMS